MQSLSAEVEDGEWDAAQRAPLCVKNNSPSVGQLGFVRCHHSQRRRVEAATCDGDLGRGFYFSMNKNLTKTKTSIFFLKTLETLPSNMKEAEQTQFSFCNLI